MHEIVAFGIFVAAFVVQPPAPSLNARAIREIVSTIRGFRLGVLEDRTPIDFCAVDNLWDANGDFIATDEIGDLLRFRKRQECLGQHAREARTVELTSFAVRGDSVIAVTETRKNGSRIAERYTLLGARTGKFGRPEYRVFSIIEK